jgi:hypothetical protein
VTRRQSFFLALMLLLAASAAWLLVRPGETARIADDDSILASGDASREPVAPRPANDQLKPAPRPAAPKETKPEAATPTRAAPGSKAIRVAIRAPDGARAGKTIVYLWRRFGGATESFAVAPDGTVDIALPDDVAAGRAVASLVVSVEGRPPLEVPLDPARRAAGTAPVELPRTAPLSGRVVDEQGKPMARMSVMATTAELPPHAVRGEDIDLRTALGVGKFLDVVRGTTDDDGRFTLDVTPGAGYAIVTDADGWLLDPPGRAMATQAGSAPAGLTATATPAVTLRGRVTDAGTGIDVPYSFWTIVPRGASQSPGFRWGVASADVRVTWPRGAGLSDLAQFDATVSASGAAVGDDPVAAKGGYVPQSIDLTYLGGETSIRRDVKLSRAAAVGEASLTYEFRDEDDKPVDFEAYLEISTAAGERGAVAFAGLAQVESGRYAAKVAPGDWTIVLRVRQPLQEMVTSKDRVTLATGETQTIRCKFPALGKLSVTWPYPARGGGWNVSLTAAAGSPSYDESTPHSGKLRFDAVPVGRWRLHVYGAGDPNGGFSRDVEIAAGKTESVDFSK